MQTAVNDQGINLHGKCLFIEDRTYCCNLNDDDDDSDEVDGWFCIRYFRFKQRLLYNLIIFFLNLLTKASLFSEEFLQYI